VDVGRFRRDHDDLELQVEQIGKTCGPYRFFRGRCPQPVVDVNEHRLDAEGRLHPPSRGGKRE
jgi:hypothetical protein